MLQRTKQFGWRPDTRAYAAVVDLLCREQRVVEAEEMLEEMSGRGLVPLLHPRWWSMRIVRTGMSDAVRVFEKMKLGWCKPNVWT
jgi:pentatricopeptide repeat protein